MASYNPSPPSRDVTGSVRRAAEAAAQPAPQPSWNWEGGTAITAQQGDTADTLAQRYGVPAAVIVQANNLPGPLAIKPGQRLVIPNTTRRRSAPAACSAAAPGRCPRRPPAGQHVHIVAPGETLMKLSRQYHKPLAEIAKANNIQPHTLVKIGDRIVIPGVRAQQRGQARRRRSGRSAAARRSPRAAASTGAPPRRAGQHRAQPSPPATPRTNPAPPESQARQSTAATMPTFRWPVRGRVITGFGPKPSGQQNDGINVAVPEGTPIKAAEDGVVAYAGNELKTYGNLVLVRHSNGYVTAYAHASEIMVKRDDPIKRGQVIAKSGQTGNVTAPQLHFEIRKGSTPVDPMPYLDKGGNI